MTYGRLASIMVDMRPYSEDLRRRIVAAVRERAAFVRVVSGATLSVSTVRRLLRGLGFSQKNGAWVRARGTGS